MRDFREARAILSRQIQTEGHLYYPFRVAGEYATFVTRWFPELDDAESEELRGAAEHALTRMGRLSDQERFMRHTREARAKLESVVQRCAGGDDSLDVKNQSD